MTGIAPKPNGHSSAAARFLRGAIIALAPALIAFGGEGLLSTTLGARWLLMLCAVIISAANGGILTGLVTTITSAALVWWFFIPPVRTLGAAQPRYYLSVALFLAIGYAISLLHERLRRTTAVLERAARENKIFAALIENSLDFIGITDPEGNPLYLNPGGRRMVEMPNDVVLEDTRILDYYPEDARAYAKDVILTDMRARDRWAGETSFRNWRTDASIPVLDTHFLVRDPATREIIGLATITRDISAQKAQRDALEKANERLAATTRELAESQRFLQGILDHSPNAIVIKNLDGRYVTVNNAFRSITHLGHEEASGRCDTELFPEPLAQRLQANDRLAIASHKPVVTEEWMDVYSEHRTFLLTKFALSDDADRIFALCGIWTDITPWKQLQRVRDEWTSVIAHDLRQPIGAILMASDLLPELHEGAVNEKEQTLVTRIHMAAESLRRMVNDLLDMSLLEANRLELQRTWINAHDLAKGTLERVAHLGGSDRVRIRQDSDAPRICVDQMRIEQVLSNLVSNALKYGDAHTDVIIQLEQRDKEVQFAVTNRGSGIAPDELPHLFDRFTRSKTAKGSSARGLGLGLYIAKGVVEAHGGKLWAESTPGETTTFHVLLPISAEVREAA